MSEIILLNYGVGDKVIIKEPGIKAKVTFIRIEQTRTIFCVEFWVETSLMQVELLENDLRKI